MSVLSIVARAILPAIAIAVFVAGPVHAEGDLSLFGDIFDDLGTSKGEISANKCGDEDFKDVISGIEIEPEGPYWGNFEMFFGDDIVGVDDIEGLYIERKPGEKLAMTLDNVSYVLLNDAIDGLLAVLCDGTLDSPIVIKKFTGELKDDLDKIKVHFRSRFDWMDSEGKVRDGFFDFDSKFTDLRPLDD